MADLFKQAQAGLKIKKIIPNLPPYSKKRLLNTATFRIFEEFLTFQYIIVAEK